MSRNNTGYGYPSQVATGDAGVFISTEAPTEAPRGIKELYAHALSLVEGKREEDYGVFGDNAVNLAAAFNAITDNSITPLDVPIFMKLLKLIRLKGFDRNGDVGRAEDSLADDIGYAGLAWRDIVLAAKNGTGKEGGG